MTSFFSELIETALICAFDGTQVDQNGVRRPYRAVPIGPPIGPKHNRGPIPGLSSKVVLTPKGLVPMLSRRPLDSWMPSPHELNGIGDALTTPREFKRLQKVLFNKDRPYWLDPRIRSVFVALEPSEPLLPNDPTKRCWVYIHPVFHLIATGMTQDAYDRAENPFLK